MAISKYNSEGYYDPTAYEGLKRVEETIDTLKVVYPKGFMEINLNKFFPCKLKKAKKIFSLINSYSSMSDKNRLMKFLKNKEKKYCSVLNKYSEKISYYPENSSKHRKYLAKFNEESRNHHRLIRNIEIFEKGREKK